MRKSRGEKVLGRREGRVRGRFEGARVQKSFFAAADIRGWKLVFYACLSNEFRAFSEQCHATLSIGRDASSLSTMIDRRLSSGTKTTRFDVCIRPRANFFLKILLLSFPPPIFPILFKRVTLFACRIFIYLSFWWIESDTGFLEIS